MSEQQQQDDEENNVLFDRILNNQATMYDVLGVEQNTVDNASLRKAYLKTSVVVHPDKNPPHLHETATRAFQKVALAYQVLSNEQSRAEYDEKLLKRGDDNHAEDYFSDNNNNNNETYYAYSAPSYQDAMFVFASVVGSAMGSRGVSGANVMTDAAQCLYWAQQWLNKNQSSDNGERGQSSSTTTTPALLALGSSLKVASSAARMMGFRKSADALQRTGNVTQAAGAASMVAEHMGVDVNKLVQNERVQRLSSNMSKSVKKVLQQQQKKKQKDNDDDKSS